MKLAGNASDFTSYVVQVATETEAVIAGLADCSIVAHTALATIDGRQYAVVNPAA